MLRKSLQCAAWIIVLSMSATAFAQSEGQGAPAGAAATAKPDEAAPGGTGPAAVTPAGTSPGADTTVAPEPTSANYAVQLKSLEQRVNELKERIFRSKARLNLLKETVLHGVIAGSRALIVHKNEMGSSFRLIKLVYALDGAQIYAQNDDTGALDEKKEFEIFNGSIVPGNHTITVIMVYRGHGYGIFSYLKGYKFTVRSSHTFTAGEGKQTGITVRAYEQGNITTELKDRPAIKFEVNLFATTSKGGSK